ncbi:MULTISPECIES: hypothetical protein [unclassified Thioalkalivibrio]|uniref:hypothetical protein n=1 Tax=unclassified Thioalkalivibrio TaxID=2621013 RepID=UPI00036A452F|nr:MULTISPECIES: hypothetical protein [unclassified Thioalkalivibrio]
MVLLILYIPSVLVALGILFMARRAALGPRVRYALATLMLPVVVLFAGWAIAGGDPSMGVALTVLFFGFVVVPAGLGRMFVRRYPSVSPAQETNVNPRRDPLVTDVAGQESDGAGHESDSGHGNDVAPRQDDRARAMRLAFMVHTPGAMLLGLGLAERLGNSDPLLSWFENGWVVDGMLLLGVVLIAISTRMILATVFGPSSKARDSGSLGRRNPRL